MFTRIPLKGAAEYDALTSWRKVYCYLQKPGATKYIKNKYNRRFRRKTKEELRKLIDEDF